MARHAFKINPLFKQHRGKYLCSVETDSPHGSYVHNWPLDNETDGRVYCQILFNAKPAEGTIVKTVALMKDGIIVDVYDGEWHSDSVNRMFKESEQESEDDKALCEQGIHSWVDEQGRLPPGTRCTRCGETYGETSEGNF